MKHSRKGLAFLGLSAVLSVQAAQFDVSVPVDLARAFAGGGTIYRGLPPDFPSFTLPAGLSVMGSHDLGNFQRVLLRSAPEGGEAQRAIAQALLAEGWTELPAQAPARETGFIIPDPGTPRPKPVMLCQDDFGRLEVRGETGVENRVYLQRFAYEPAARGTSCEEHAQNLATPRAPRSSVPPLQPYLPVLAAPPSSLPQPNQSLFGSGSGSSFERDTLVAVVDLSAGELLAHYARQMREQDWEADAEWAGEITAGGTWMRSVENGDRLMAMLLIDRVEEEVFSVKLAVQDIE